MNSYSKPPLSVDEQILLLTERGMVINDNEKVKQFLLFNNYYKFAGYWKIFATNGTHILNKNNPDNSFDYFHALYLNDKQLSHIILRYISIMEDALRTQYAYHLSLSTSQSHPHLNKHNFSINKYDKLKESLIDSFDKSPHKFKIHYQNNYIEELPPIWVLVEHLSLGNLIHLITITDSNKINDFFTQFNYKRSLLKSFLHSLCFVRNQCAHNSILWNIDYAPFPEIPKNNKNGILSKINIKREKIILNFILILVYLLESLNLNDTIRTDFQNFFDSIDEKYLEGYGIDLENKKIF